MRKILMSVVTIGAVSALGLLSSQAFFSDTETSTGNLFQAGAIDLQIDNSSYLNSGEGGAMEFMEDLSWELRDLTDEVFFNYEDAKPGDLGEDTISFHLTSNPAWMCADIDITANDDASSTEPELEDGDDEEDPNDDFDGELADALNFIFWVDDGDNVLEVEEQVLTQGPASDVLDGVTWAMADSQTPNVFTGQVEPVQPTDPESPHYIAKAWCYGELIPQPNDGSSDDGPDVQGPGVLCDGEPLDNTTQTDILQGDISFRAVQARNNPDFVCERPEEEQPLVGAALGGYDAPQCDETVGSEESIQEVLDERGDEGEIVCVPDGTYSENIDIEIINLTLAGINPPTDTATIDGRIKVDATGVTVTGLEILGADDVSAEGTNGIYVVGGSNDLTISYNVIDGDGRTSPARGIHFAAGGVTNASVMHNVIRNWNSSGTYINPTTGPMNFSYNSYLSNNVGIGSDGIQDVDVMNNHFDGNTAEAIGMSDTAQAVSDVVINTNNFVPAGPGNNVNPYGTTGGVTPIDATNNWWDSEAESDRSNDDTKVETVPAAGSAFPEN